MFLAHLLKLSSSTGQYFERNAMWTKYETAYGTCDINAFSNFQQKLQN